jgi:hypothetical protein
MEDVAQLFGVHCRVFISRVTEHLHEGDLLGLHRHETPTRRDFRVNGEDKTLSLCHAFPHARVNANQLPRTVWDTVAPARILGRERGLIVEVDHCILPLDKLAVKAFLPTIARTGLVDTVKVHVKLVVLGNVRADGAGQ